MTRNPLRLSARHVAHAAALLCPLALLQPAGASEHRYTFTGLATVGAVDGGPSVHPYSGVFIFNDDFPSTTEYMNNSVVQGFKTTYLGAVTYLGITLDNNERVEAYGGNLQVNNVQQAEVGSPWPEGLSLQAWMSGTGGTINGLSISNMYLAFLPVTPNFSWDGLDAEFGGNAEQMLSDNPALLPPGMDPLLTGTALPESLPATFTNGLFLGTNHGLVNTVNPVYTLVESAAPVPETGSGALLAVGTLALWGALRRRVV
jgi:hypothetical protein